MMILLAIIYLVLLFTVTEITLFVSIVVVAIYFWKITGILIGIILAFMLAKWLLTEFFNGLNDLANIRKDFGWDIKKKKHADDDRIMHVGKDKMNELDEWFNGKKEDETKNMPTRTI